MHRFSFQWPKQGLRSCLSIWFIIYMPTVGFLSTCGLSFSLMRFFHVETEGRRWVTQPSVTDDEASQSTQGMV